MKTIEFKNELMEINGGTEYPQQVQDAVDAGYALGKAVGTIIKAYLTGKGLSK